MTLLTVKDVATRLQVKDKTVYAWASQRKIPCVKIGGTVRFDPKEIEQWLQMCRVPMGMSSESSRSRHKGRSTPKKDVDLLIESAKRSAYSIGGETRPIASPYGREGANGAR